MKIILGLITMMYELMMSRLLLKGCLMLMLLMQVAVVATRIRVMTRSAHSLVMRIDVAIIVDTLLRVRQGVAGF